MLAGVVSTLAGAATAGWVDGVGAAAKFTGPKGVSVDSNGVVFVADYGNYRVRRVTSAGSVWGGARLERCYVSLLFINR